ncbi:MAG: polyphosphate kinase 2 family protein [Anaerolineae bacterium]|nr:polyphosphate kinase 2 family protein [Anaerolineae bacterium]MCA9887881.1 polyphosphate kinase 2 family protein [Anaerolineae bacterium]MCA9892977.1 polyphosphate kinase 2 family protein [Anaerolineae bacterium]
MAESNKDVEVLVPKPLSNVKLSKYDTRYDGDMDRKTAKALENQYEERLFTLQEMLYAQGKKALLIVLQAMDAGGKDSTIKHVFDAVNPQGVRVNSFKVPTAEELAHDFLWRIHKQVPAKGYIGIFNRSHYEDVLVVRVNNIVPEEVWSKRYDLINDFERLLTENGVHILKFYLHLSKEEQRERFQERLDRPEKNWKFSKGDLAVREQWNDYMQAYEAVLSKCNTEYAPWYIIPADRKWYRDYVITKAIVQEMEKMGLAYPEPEDNLDDVVIPD